MAQRLREAPMALGVLEVVAEFYGPMPVGVTVSHQGRVFVCFPRWGDPVDFTVAELRDGHTLPYPDAAANLLDPDAPAESLISVQSVVVDPDDRLWALDTGRPRGQPIPAGGQKLVGIDLARDEVVRTIVFPGDGALPTTYLNDVRFDLRRGAAGMAFITDSSTEGPNGIIVVDLHSGRSWRRLHDHPSTKAEWAFLPIVEGEPLMTRPREGPPTPLRTGSDGIAISADGKRLYYCPLASRRLYSVSVDALADERLSDTQVAETVLDHGEKGASDGLESDDRGRIYATNYEHSAILRRNPDGTHDTLVQDARLLWPDTLSVSMDRHLYVIANQLHRQPGYHHGEDLRRKPYHLFRMPIDAGPVLLT